MHVPDPGALSDEEWAEDLQSLHYIRKNEADANKIPTQ